MQSYGAKAERCKAPERALESARGPDAVVDAGFAKEAGVEPDASAEDHAAGKAARHLIAARDTPSGLFSKALKTFPTVRP